MPQAGAHLIFRKGSPLMVLFNKAINEETVFIRRVLRKYDQFTANRRDRFCGEDSEARKKFHPLGIVPVLGLLALFLVGFIMAALLLGIEIALFSRCVFR